MVLCLSSALHFTEKVLMYECPFREQAEGLKTQPGVEWKKITGSIYLRHSCCFEHSVIQDWDLWHWIITICIFVYNFTHANWINEESGTQREQENLAVWCLKVALAQQHMDAHKCLPAFIFSLCQSIVSNRSSSLAWDLWSHTQEGFFSAYCLWAHL